MLFFFCKKKKKDSIVKFCCNFAGCGSGGEKPKGKQFHFCDSRLITHISRKECLLNKEPQSGTCQSQAAWRFPLYSRRVRWVIVMHASRIPEKQGLAVPQLSQQPVLPTYMWLAWCQGTRRPWGSPPIAGSEHGHTESIPFGGAELMSPGCQHEGKSSLGLKTTWRSKIHSKGFCQLRYSLSNVLKLCPHRHGRNSKIKCLINNGKPEYLKE